jgi:DNA-binding transcriptional MocR family regulator
MCPELLPPLCFLLPAPCQARAGIASQVTAAGKLSGTHRDLSAKLGIPASTLSTSARRLADRGLIKVGNGVLMAA